MPLDPGAVTVLNLIKELGRPPLHTLTPAEAREATAKSRAVMQPEPETVAEVEDLAGPGPLGPIPLRLYRAAGTPAGEVLPCLLYCHGGGWVIGDLDSHDELCRELANAARCCVVAVDYRMAPEHVSRGGRRLARRDALHRRAMRRRCGIDADAHRGGRRQRRRQPGGRAGDQARDAATCRSASSCCSIRPPTWRGSTRPISASPRSWS